MAIAVVIFFSHASAQVLVSGGTYAQNFVWLASTNAFWANNLTLPGWYAAVSGTDTTNTRAGAGTSNTGGLYSFGTNGVNPLTDRALGSLASSGNTYAYGIRFTNDTGLTVTNISVSYTGEQWRNGGSGVASSLTFSYGISSSPITNSTTAAAWAFFPALNFVTPTVGLTASALDGNHAANRQTFTGMVLTGVTVPPGYEFFLRWLDTDDSGSDSAMALDDLAVDFQTVASPPPSAAFSNSSVTLLTYNVAGNGTTDWSTNAPQVQAIGRQLVYLQADVITFNEIPLTNTWQMANWVSAYLPGYYLATNSGTDGFIRSAIMSRFPIVRSQKWLDGADLDPFGYTTADFTRDLFEAEINVPNWPLPLHVFTTHLKSSNTGYTDAAAKRAAEAAAITNFFATNFFLLHPGHPFALTGDMNEANTNTTAIQRLISAPSTLQLTGPTNPFTGSINTYTIRGSVTERIDYIFPGALLASNVTASQVFRTDKLTSFPPNLFSNDNTIASDHLPVLMTFANPFNTPFRLLAFNRTNQNVTLKWESQKNRRFQIEASSNLIAWTPFATNLLATTTNSPFVFTSNNVADHLKFFRIHRVP